MRCAQAHAKQIIPIFDKNFSFPPEEKLPMDVRHVVRLNGITWVHEYQEACVDKIVKYVIVSTPLYQLKLRLDG